jgi:hypothetical protein
MWTESECLARFILTTGIGFGHEPPIRFVEILSSLRFSLNAALRQRSKRPVFREVSLFGYASDLSRQLRWDRYALADGQGFSRMRFFILIKEPAQL